MARARNVKPMFFKNEDLAECTPWARLLFVGLWCLADREGRLEDRPKRIKAELFPFDSIEAEPLLCELARYGFIARYEVDGARFIAVLAFARHQHPHHKEPPSTIPPPPQSPGLQPHASRVEPEALAPWQDGDASDKPEACPGLAGDECAKDGGQTRLIPDSGFLIPDSGSRIADSGSRIADCGLLMVPTQPPPPPPAAPPPAAATPTPAAAAAADTPTKAPPRNQRGTRLEAGFVLPEAWRAWALTKNPHWTLRIVETEAERFTNYYPSKAETRTDWFATWRNWCTSKLAEQRYPAPVSAEQLAESMAKAEQLQAEARRLRNEQAMAIHRRMDGRSNAPIEFVERVDTTPGAAPADIFGSIRSAPAPAIEAPRRATAPPGALLPGRRTT